MALSEKDAPFIEPYAKPGNPNGFKSKGNTALAVKRALAHLGFMDWEPDAWDKQWNEKLNSAAVQWKRKRGLIPSTSNDGSWGEKAHTEMRGVWFGADKKPAFDGESQRLLKEEKAAQAPPAPPPGSEDDFRKALVEFCNRGMGQSDWNYTQGRAVDPSINPDGPANSDCSGSVIQAYYYANQKTGKKVPCPAKYDYSGYGNTWDDEDGHPKVTNGSYKVGDLAHYDGHVCMCMKAGNSDTADWWSFGSEPPSKRKLYYRTDFKFVVRPPMSPSPDTYQTTFERLTFTLRFWRIQRLALFWKNGKRRGDPPSDPR